MKAGVTSRMLMVLLNRLQNGRLITAGTLWFSNDVSKSNSVSVWSTESMNYDFYCWAAQRKEKERERSRCWAELGIFGHGWGFVLYVSWMLQRTGLFLEDEQKVVLCVSVICLPGSAFPGLNVVPSLCVCVCVCVAVCLSLITLWHITVFICVWVLC